MQPAKGTFYQPLNADSESHQVEWEQRLDGLAELEISTLYLQWSRHDRSTFGMQGGWLWRLMRQASDQGFNLVVGLHADSDFFDHVNEHFNAAYWAEYIEKNIVWGQQMNTLLRQQPELRVAGFFFPGELNDRLLADAATLEQVAVDVGRLQRRLGRPLYVSVFYTGYLSTADYKLSLQRLRQSDVHVLHQDGAGTTALNKNQVDETLLALNCEFTVIEELFVQRSDAGFTAISEDLVRAKVAQRSCHPRVFFSWRYMTPW